MMVMLEILKMTNVSGDKRNGRYCDPDDYVVTSDNPYFKIDVCKTDEEAKESIKHIVEQINNGSLPGWFFQRLYEE